MKAVIAGGTGFLGSALAESFRSDGHQVAIVTRHPRRPGEVPWSDVSAFDGADVVINLAGVPAISVPCGLDGEGLPIGMQVIGKHFDEPTILRVAYAYEQQTDWHRKKPAFSDA